MRLLTNSIRAKLEKNFHRTMATGESCDVVLKLFGGSSMTWLITDIDPEDGDTMMGLCDIGHGCCEFGSVSLSELASIKFRPFGLGVERDLRFRGGPVSKYRDYYDEHGTLNGC